jgi:hypothetical protein
VIVKNIEAENSIADGIRTISVLSNANIWPISSTVKPRKPRTCWRWYWKKNGVWQMQAGG